MDLPPMHAEVERLGLGDLVEAVRRRLPDGVPFALEAAQQVVDDLPKLTPEQTRFLLANGLDAVVGAIDEEKFEFQRSQQSA